MINRFDGTEYAFLSNFYLADVTYDGLAFTSSEAAFQAAKVLEEEKRKEFCNLNPKSAKAKGKKVPLRGDWEKVKDQVMYEVCTAKFEQHPDLMEKLLATGDEELVEGNTWRDQYWGVYKGKGKNMLGKTLMRIREEHR